MMDNENIALIDRIVGITPEAIKTSLLIGFAIIFVFDTSKQAAIHWIAFGSAIIFYFIAFLAALLWAKESIESEQFKAKALTLTHQPIQEWPAMDVYDFEANRKRRELDLINDPIYREDVFNFFTKHSDPKNTPLSTAFRTADYIDTFSSKSQ